MHRFESRVNRNLSSVQLSSVESSWVWRREQVGVCAVFREEGRAVVISDAARACVWVGGGMSVGGRE